MCILGRTHRATLVLGAIVAIAVSGAPAVVNAEDASPVPAAATPTAAVSEAPRIFISEGTTIPDVERSQEALATITDRAEYGGAFLHTDPERRYMLAVMWTGDIEALASELQTLLGEDAAFEIRAVEYSDAELMAVSDAISDLTPELNERGVLVVSISRDAEANRVDVGIEGPLEVAEELLAPFGEVVRVLQEDVPTLD
jgi:hypothetical protein